jgi:hypothetical protein
MAGFTKTNGTTQPVFNLDVRNGSIAGTANIAAQGPVQPQGPKLDFFSLTANTSLASGGNVNGYINNIFQAIQSGAGIAGGGAGGTVAMYQVDPTSPAILNIAIYPTGAYTTAQIVAAAQTANATGGLNIGIPTANVAGSATFTNV